ncbi:MAG: hypothetical protein JXD22_05485 [Sedimentisphaerales bacterium]|nr:hypothetical protein [Sedimentisphaerales bacterium]
MAKKIILFAVTLVSVLVLFLIYQQTTSVDGPTGRSEPTAPRPIVENIDKVKPLSSGALETGVVEVGGSDNLVFTATDKGRIVRKFGFTERLESPEGILKISLPWVQIFPKDPQSRSVIEITARTGNVPVESSSGRIEMPQMGQLEDVRVEMIQLAPDQQGLAIPPERDAAVEYAVEMEVLLEGLVGFELEFSRLNCPGRFEVSSAQFDASGWGLNLQYDQVNEALQDLELLRLERLAMSQGSLAGQSESGESEREGDLAVAEESSPESAAKKADERRIATYRFTLVDEVVVDQGGEKLLADKLEIIKDVDYAQLRSGGKKAEGEADKTGDTDEVKDNKLPEAGPSEAESKVLVTCKGPLRITTVDPAVIEGAAEGTGAVERTGERLEMTATGQPARIYRDDRVAVEADRIVFDQVTQRSGFISDSDRPVKLSLADDQMITARTEVEVDHASRVAELTGPGMIEYVAEANQESSTIAYEGQLQVHFGQSEPGKEGENLFSSWGAVEQFSFDGRLTAQSPEGQFEADKGLLKFYPALPPDPDAREAGQQNRPGPLESIDLWGNVAGKGSESNFFARDHMQATYALDSNKQQSYLQEILARGNVRAEDPNFIIEAGESLQLMFDKGVEVESAAGAEVAGAEVAGAADGLKLGQMLKNTDFRSAVVRGPDNTVRLTSKDDGYLIVGDYAEGNATDDLWKISGDPARIVSLYKDDRLEAPLIIANRKTGLFETPGSGSMNVSVKGDMFGQILSEPMPMVIEWLDGARFNLDDGTVVLGEAQGRLEVIDQNLQVTELKGREFVVEFATKTVADKDSDKTGDNDLLTGRELSRFVAAGPGVQVTRSEFNLQDEKLLNQMKLHGTELQYNDSSQELLLPGPGWVEVVDYREKAGSSRGDTFNKSVATMLGREGASYSLMQFGQYMKFDQARRKLTFAGDVAVDQMPLHKEMAQYSNLIEQSPGIRRLVCDDFDVYFQQKSQEKSEKDNAEKSSGKAELGAVKLVEAHGSIFAEVINENGQQHIFSGQELAYENQLGLLSITGSEKMPAQFDQMQFSSVHWDMNTRKIEAIPLGHSAVAGQR